MQALTKAIDEIKFRIPSMILQQTFKQQSYSWRNAPITTDEQILNLVVRARVLIDCNIVGGTEVLIPLATVQPEYVDQFTLIYHIPKSLIQGRTIMSVKSVGYLNPTGMPGGVMSTVGAQHKFTDVGNAANAVMQSHSAAPIMSNSNTQLIGDNVVMVKTNGVTMVNNIMRCMVSDDANMNHLQVRSLPDFCKLVELAVKSYIYNTLVINMGNAMLSGGQELGIFKTIVDGYADSEQMYQDFLKNTWQAVAFMNDEVQFSRHLKLISGGMH